MNIILKFLEFDYMHGLSVSRHLIVVINLKKFLSPLCTPFMLYKTDSLSLDGWFAKHLYSKKTLFSFDHSRFIYKMCIF